MNTGKIKNVVIIVLGMLTIYQAAGLWFDISSDHNLFYSFFSKQNTAIFSVQYNLMESKETIIGFGNKNFNLVNTQKLVEEDLDKKVIECMKYLFQSGSYVSTSNINWDELLENKAVIYKYDVKIPTNYYSKFIVNKSVQNFSTKQEYFDIIVIVPARSTGEQMKVYFLNSYEDKCVLFEAKKNLVNDNLYSEIDKIQNSNFAVNYISSKQNKLDIFGNNIFLPELSGKNVTYAKLKLKNPYGEDEELSVESIEKYIDNFFNNSLAKWSAVDFQGVYIYNDENVVVRYYPSCLLEYFDYSTATSKNNDLESTLQAVQEFLYKDIVLPEEIRISNIKQENDEWTIGFDRYVNGIPIEISNDILQDLGIENEIEIKVKNSKVISYKRYVYDVEKVYIKKNFSSEVSFVNGLNRIIAGLEEKNVIVEDMYLSYIVSRNDISDIMWTAVINDEKYSETIEMSE